MREARRPLARFLRIEAASGILLIAAAAVALLLANSSLAESYRALWHAPLGVRLGAMVFERPLEWFVNDVLMVVFFFVVGLEIRREIAFGELSEWRRAALPVVAAVGGMIVPAGVYLAFATEPAIRGGWGVPMATDIAFAIGVLALLGNRVPAALRVLLLALAVIDDLGAIIVIALFYSAGIDPTGIVVALVGLLGVVAFQRIGVRAKVAYILPAAVAWWGTYQAGIHPTIAGVAVGLMTPVRAWLGPEGFVTDARDALATSASIGEGQMEPARLHALLRWLDTTRREAVSPAESLIETLHPWVAYGIMPIFALANAGVTFDAATLDTTGTVVAAAVAAGLLVGKPVGILAACGLGLRLGLTKLPQGLTSRHLLVLGVVAAIGFTMSIFIASLAFSDARLLAAAKVGVQAASGTAAAVSLVLGSLLLDRPAQEAAVVTVDEAERSTEQ